MNKKCHVWKMPTLGINKPTCFDLHADWPLPMVPTTKKTDLDLTFNSTEFNLFLKHYNVNHLGVTSLWTESDKHVKRLAQILQKSNPVINKMEYHKIGSLYLCCVKSQQSIVITSYFYRNHVYK